MNLKHILKHDFKYGFLHEFQTYFETDICYEIAEGFLLDLYVLKFVKDFCWNYMLQNMSVKIPSCIIF